MKKNKKKIVIIIILIVICIIIIPNTTNRIRYEIEKLTGNVNSYIEIVGIGIAKIENDYPNVDTINLKGETITISKKQTEGAEEVYIYGTIVNSFERPNLELNGVENAYSPRVSNQQIVSAFSPAYIYRGFAFNLDVAKLKSKNTVIIRCNDKEEKFVLYMN